MLAKLNARRKDLICMANIFPTVVVKLTIFSGVMIINLISSISSISSWSKFSLILTFDVDGKKCGKRRVKLHYSTFGSQLKQYFLWQEFVIR